MKALKPRWLATQRQEGTRVERHDGYRGRETLWRPKAYGWMWHETRPRGSGGTKPLRGWETLGAEGGWTADRPS